MNDDDDDDPDFGYDDRAAGPRGRAWLAFLYDPDQHDHRPVLAEMAKMPEAKRYGKYKDKMNARLADHSG